MWNGTANPWIIFKNSSDCHYDILWQLMSRTMSITEFKSSILKKHVSHHQGNTSPNIEYFDMLMFSVLHTLVTISLQRVIIVIFQTTWNRYMG